MYKFAYYFHPMMRFNRERTRWAQNSNIPELYLNLIQQPSISVDTLSSELDYIVLDFETTGIDSETDEILSIGWVDITQGRVDLATSQHFYISDQSILNPDACINRETAVINQITPQMLKDGIPLEEAMTLFFEASVGKVMVAHACMIETAFMNHYLRKTHDINEPPFMWLDTLLIEKNLAASLYHQDLDVSLSSTRERYNLPAYNGHNALADAIATAELLLVQDRRVACNHETKFEKLFRLSHGSV